MPASSLHAIGFALLISQATFASEAGDHAVPAATGGMPLHVDAAGRLEADVTLDGKGPFRFTVDTASNGAVLSQAVAGHLRFRAGDAKRVVGGIGRASSQSVSIDDYRTALFDRHDESMALLPSLSTDGILGMSPFAQQRIEFDLAGHALRAGSSGPTPEGFASQPGELRHGILVVGVVIDGVRAQAVIDTGAPYNIGNPQLQARLGFVMGDLRLSPGGTFTDTFGQEREVQQATLGRIGIGSIAFSSPTVRFADMPIFRALGLDDGPALILGVEQLSHMEAIAIDFPRAELQMRP
ncbi:MAG TPA: aspartyl protease family protein [Xanthomonadaceae bacterium]